MNSPSNLKSNSLIKKKKKESHAILSTRQPALAYVQGITMSPEIKASLIGRRSHISRVVQDALDNPDLTVGNFVSDAGNLDVAGLKLRHYQYSAEYMCISR